MGPLELVRLAALMDRSRGIPDLAIGLIDGPVATDHPDLTAGRIREMPGTIGATCSQASNMACLHGTFVAGILSAQRGASAPAICPDCTLLVRPIFSESLSGSEQMPSVTPRELAAAIIECVDAGARVINLSLGLARPSIKEEYALEAALTMALRRGAIVVAAAGNQGTVGSSAITRHPWVIPVVACDVQGRPTSQSNLGGTIGQRGLSAPGDRIVSLGSEGPSLTLGGTSVAVPFVTGAIALLWSEFPSATASQVKLAMAQPVMRRPSIVPPLLDAAAAYQAMANAAGRRSTA